MAEARPLPNGTELNGRYRILQRLNSGGFGITYLAHAQGNTQVVLKEYFPPWFATRNEGSKDVLPNAGSEEDFRRYYKLFEIEAKQLAAMRHDNIVSLSGAFRENNTAYYAMPYIGGGSLSQAIKAMRTEGAWPSQITVLFILRSLLNALEHMHSRKLQGKPIYHLDIKPGNILLTDNGNQSSPVFIDLGSANMGTPGFMPHEQCENDGAAICPATDLFALGATLFMLLTGRKPEPHVDKDNHVVAPPRQHCLAKDETLLERYDEELLASIDKSLAWEPSDRFSCARAWLEAIEDVSIRFSDDGINMAQMVHLIKTVDTRSVPLKASAPKKQVPAVPKAPAPQQDDSADNTRATRKSGGGLKKALTHPAVLFCGILIILLGCLIPFLSSGDSGSIGTGDETIAATEAQIPEKPCTAGTDDSYYAVKGNSHYEAMKQCGCRNCMDHINRLEQVCYVADGAREKAQYNDDTYKAMVQCAQDKNCELCGAQAEALKKDFMTCKISPASRAASKYNDDTYRAMQQCVKDRDCADCKAALAKICTISAEARAGAKLNDDTYRAMQQCVRDRDCADCKAALAKICTIPAENKASAELDDDTYRAMQECSKNKGCSDCSYHIERINNEIARAREEEERLAAEAKRKAEEEAEAKRKAAEEAKRKAAEEAKRKTCTISNRARNRATKGSSTYYEMQACARDKGCRKCRNRVNQLDNPPPPPPITPTRPPIRTEPPRPTGPPPVINAGCAVTGYKPAGRPGNSVYRQMQGCGCRNCRAWIRYLNSAYPD